MTGAAISRLDDVALEKLLGSKAVSRRNAKNCGGASNFKGGRYEEFFGAHRVARLARKLIANQEDALVEWQSDCFVDDFVVRRDHNNSFKGYQLKNSPAVSWGSPDEGIASDFALQQNLSAAEGYVDIRLRLVCSNQSTVNNLTNTLPSSISSWSRASFFPYEERLLHLFKVNPWLAEDFGFLSKHERPTKMDVEQVATIMMGAWSAKAPTALVSEVVEQARNASPTIVRAFGSDADAMTKLQPVFKGILDQLPDFEYEIKRGFLRWRAMGKTMSGVLSYDCFRSEFAKLQSHIISMQPTSFQDIEGVLV